MAFMMHSLLKTSHAIKASSVRSRVRISKNAKIEFSRFTSKCDALLMKNFIEINGAILVNRMNVCFTFSSVIIETIDFGTV